MTIWTWRAGSLAHAGGQSWRVVRPQHPASIPGGAAPARTLATTIVIAHRARRQGTWPGPAEATLTLTGSGGHLAGQVGLNAATPSPEPLVIVP